ncbi:MAG TPA: 3-hydroxybutyryl-CoA dehydratase, partial [Pseudomonas sp.]|nr:3-hydroxybutyryl-CoA dehydratase [Pseudomonas sp.]
RVINQDGKQVVDGVATVMAPTEKVSIDRPQAPAVQLG